MSFWNIFKNEENNDTFSSQLHKELSEHFPESNELKLEKIACFSGLLARVALVDLKRTSEERASIKNAISELTDYNQEDAEKICQIALEHVKELAGLEDHKYGQFLSDSCNNDEKMQILTALFAVAASDGNADNLESEEIRNITKSLKLEQKHFVAARATVAEHLGALKKN